MITLEHLKTVAAERCRLQPGCRQIASTTAAAAAALLVLAATVPALGLDLTSPSFRLRGANLSGGGAVMTSSASSPSIGQLGGSIGQSEALGLSGSLADLTSDIPGFWPIVAGGLPTLDLDEDSIQAFRDNCPWAFNPLQEDPGGIGGGSGPDGIGTACQCGDVDNSGTVDGFDIDDFRDFLADPVGAPFAAGGEQKCTVIGVAGPCDVLDTSVIRRTVDGPDLAPGISQVCEAAVAP